MCQDSRICGEGLHHCPLAVTKVPVPSVRPYTTCCICFQSISGWYICAVPKDLNSKRLWFYSSCVISSCIVSWWRWWCWSCSAIRCDIVYDVNDLGDVVNHSIPNSDKLPDYVVYLNLFLLA